MSVALIRYEPPPTRELESRLVYLGELRIELAALEKQYEADRSRLREFEKRYRPAVGVRHNELEELREKLARAKAALARARCGELEEPVKEAAAEDLPQEAFRPAVELRKIFRDLARRIHPDLAEDLDDRERRHEFMAEATRAYRARDLQRLQWLHEHWEAAPRLPKGLDPESRLARTNQKIAWARYRLRELHISLNALHASPAASIMREYEEARRQGRNLIVEMRAKLVRELGETRADLAAFEEALAGLDPGVARIVRANAGLDG